MLGIVARHACRQIRASYLAPVAYCANSNQLSNESSTENVTVSEQAEPTLSKRVRRLLESKARSREKRHEERGLKAEAFALEDISETSVANKNGLRLVTPYYAVFNARVVKEWEGRSVGDVAVSELLRFDVPMAQAFFKDGRFLVNDQRCEFDTILQAGDLLEYCYHRHEPPVTGEPIKVVSEDDEMLALDKPASIPMHPGGTYRHNTVTMLVKREHGLHIVNALYRLDRLTSGLVLFPKSRKMMKEFNSALKNRDVKKVYLARVLGEFPAQPVTVDEPIGVITPRCLIAAVSPEGKHARTTFERLRYDGHTSLVKCMPLHGRTHQIRVHLQHIGYPIFNDPLYNNVAWSHPSIESADVVTKVKHVLRSQLSMLDVPTAESEFGKIIAAMEQRDKKKDIFADRDARRAARRERNQRTKPSGTKSGTDDHEAAPADISRTGNHGNAPADPSRTGSHGSASVDRSRTDGHDAASVDNSRADDHNAVSVDGSPSEPASEAGADSARGDRRKRLRRNRSVNTYPELQAKYPCVQSERDDQCRRCRAPHPPPHPLTIQMHLHALSYQVGSRKYETEWPAWAKADWTMPDYYKQPDLQFAGCPIGNGKQS